MVWFARSMLPLSPMLDTLVPPTIFLPVTPRFAVKTVSVDMFARFPIYFAFALAFPVFVRAFFFFVAFAFLSLALSFALPVAFALLAFTFTQHREIHGYNTTRSEICLCSTTVEGHCSDLHVALQSV